MAKKSGLTFHKGFNSTTFNVRHGQNHMGSVSRNPNGTWRHSMMDVMQMASLNSPHKTRDAAAKALHAAVMADNMEYRKSVYAAVLASE